MSLETKFNDFKTKHNLDDDAISELLKIFNDSFIELAHKLLATTDTPKHVPKDTPIFNGPKKFATKIAAEYAAEHDLTLDDFNKEKITKKDIDELVKNRVKKIPKLDTTPKEITKESPKKTKEIAGKKCQGLTKSGDPCGKLGTTQPEGSKNFFCFRHAVDWKSYEISSDSDLEEELEEEPEVFKNPCTSCDESNNAVPDED